MQSTFRFTLTATPSSLSGTLPGLMSLPLKSEWKLLWLHNFHSACLKNQRHINDTSGCWLPEQQTGPSGPWLLWFLNTLVAETVKWILENQFPRCTFLSRHPMLFSFESCMVFYLWVQKVGRGPLLRCLMQSTWLLFDGDLFGNHAIL